MERRYLVATLAIVATFATFSSGFRSLQHLSLLNGQQPSVLSRLADKVKSQLHPAYPEEAQLLAEMNLPLAAAQARIAEQAAKQSQAAAQCARERAMRETERARRDAMRMSAEIARETNISVAPVVIDLKGLDGLDQRMQARAAALAERVATRNVRLQVAAARMQAVSMQMQDSGRHKSPCRSREIQ
jgi:hypothetical protein